MADVNKIKVGNTTYNIRDTRLDDGSSPITGTTITGTTIKGTTITGTTITGTTIKGTTFSGGKAVLTTGDASPFSAGNPGLIIGDANKEHLAFDNNEIIAKSDKDTPTTLWLNGTETDRNSGNLPAVYICGSPIQKYNIPKNQVWAAPSNKAGYASLRTLVAADITDGTLDIDRIPSIPSSKISSVAVTKVSGLGTIVDQAGTANKPCANNDWSVLPTISLAAGIWIIVGTIVWAVKSSGARGVAITDLNEDTFRSRVNDTTLPAADQHVVRVMANPTYNTITTTTRIMSLSGTKTIYLHGFQSSGAALNAISSHIQAVRIK